MNACRQKRSSWGGAGGQGGRGDERGAGGHREEPEERAAQAEAAQAAEHSTTQDRYLTGITLLAALSSNTSWGANKKQSIQTLNLFWVCVCGQSQKIILFLCFPCTGGQPVDSMSERKRGRGGIWNTDLLIIFRVVTSFVSRGVDCLALWAFVVWTCSEQRQIISDFQQISQLLSSAQYVD